MRRIIAVVCIFIILCGCAGQGVTVPSAAPTESDRLENSQSFIDTSKTFDTEEELHEAVRAAQKWSDEEKAADQAKLWNLRYYYVPETLREGYVLYKISVFAMDIATLYVREEYANKKLDFADEMLLSMRSVRVNNISETYYNTFEEAVENAALANYEREIIDNYYLYRHYSYTFVWEQDEQLMTLKFPYYYDREDPLKTVGEFTKEEMLSYAKVKRVDIMVE